MTQDRIFVAVPTYNRRAIVELCVPTIVAGCAPGDDVFVYDDGSSEYNIGELSLPVTAVKCGPSIGIDAQRRNHFLDFLERAPRHGYTHFYCADSDAFHDPSWRLAALALHRNYGALTGLYRTQTHADYHKNIFKNDLNESVIWQRFCPGVSMFLSRAQVESIAGMIPERWSWDWHVPGLFNYKCAVSRVSYVDHLDVAGLHSPESGLGPERATNPTEWLVAKRAEILSNLGLKDA